MRAQHVLVISPQKAGMHLIAELMNELGYVVVGWENRRDPSKTHRLDRRQRKQAASLVLSRWQRLLLTLVSPTPLFDRITHRALDGINLSWAERLGVPMASRYALAGIHAIYRRPRLLGLSRTNIEALPGNLCWIQHQLVLSHTDGHFLKHWSQSGKPAIIFNYRDPRDVLLSFIDYLMGRSRESKHGGFAEYHVYEKILASLPDDDARIMHAILDPSFPGHDDFANSLWLLRHPQVCKVSFEELVGRAGGSSDERQKEAIGRVMNHLGIAGDPVAMSRNLFNPQAFTFHKGRIGRWREVLSKDHLRAFNEKFSDILQLYGYESFPGSKVNS